MRKHCFDYIFSSSKIRNMEVHIKYRRKIMEGISNPDDFTYIKDFWFSYISYPFEFINS